jgi:pimeloyl-ACP methyl ester carboxylesterase
MALEITRGFVDAPEGQCHYRSCGDEKLPTLLMFHGSPGSSYSLVPLMRHLAAKRRVIAFDTFGNGDSSPSKIDRPEIGDLAASLAGVVDTLGLDAFDLYGYHTGTAICTEIAIARPRQVRRIVLEGVSVFTPSDQNGLLDNNHAPDIPIDLSGTHLIAAWTMVRDAHIFWPWWNRGADGRRSLGLPSAAYVNGEMIEVLKSARTYFKSYEAALRYPKRERLPKIAAPTLLAACPSDQLFGFLEAATGLVPGAISQVLPDPHTEADRAAAAAQMLGFLDA